MHIRGNVVYDCDMLSATKMIGNVGELAIASDLVGREFDVFFPYGDVSHIDIVAIKDARIIKFQVKTVKSSKSGVVGFKHFTNRRNVRRYTTNNIDYMALYVVDRKLIAYVPMSEIVSHKHAFSLRLDVPKNGQIKNIRYFHDYLSVV